MPSVRRAAVVTIDRDGVGDALARLRAVAERCGVALVDDDDADIAIVLGGDGTMLRALARFLGKNVPVIGVNYGRVGFLTAIAGDELDTALARVFAGDYRTVELATLEVTVAGRTSVAINDVVVAGGTLGRMIEVGYSIGGEELGSQPCDGLICATPAGSTAYNLSAQGPIIPLNAPLLALTPISPFRPRRWRGALLPDTARVTIEVIDPEKRPVAAVADHDEVRSVESVDVCMDHSISLNMLFDPGHNLDERILREQFGF